jgi:hypothetical protein
VDPADHALRQTVLELKAELRSISMIDEFAKWQCYKAFFYIAEMTSVTK